MRNKVLTGFLCIVLTLVLSLGCVPLGAQCSEHTAEELDRLAEQYDAEQKQGYCERQEKRYSRMSEYSLDPDNQRMYGARAQQWSEKAEGFKRVADSIPMPDKKSVETVEKSGGSGIISQKVSDRIINLFNETDNGVFDFEEIEKNLLSSPIGASTAKYIEDNNLTSGYTSVLWRTEDENVEFWYKNIKACRDELKVVSENENATHLEKSNVLMKVRESLVNDSESVQVIVPQGISLYPNNLVWGILRLISYIAMLLVIGWACFGDDF